METVEPIKIPDSHVKFAKAVASLAELNDIDEFTMEYKPDWHGIGDWDQRVRGKATILYNAKDSRGRPCRNLSIRFNADFNHVIDSNPSSHD